MHACVQLKKHIADLSAKQSDLRAMIKQLGDLQVKVKQAHSEEFSNYAWLYAMFLAST